MLLSRRNSFHLFKELVDLKRVQTHHDHIHRGQDKLENGTQLALESVARGVWHCVAQHSQIAAELNAKQPGRPMLRPAGSHFKIYLGLCVYGHGGASQTKNNIPPPGSSVVRHS